MRKYFCDGCGSEEESVKVFDVPCHLFSLSHSVGYCDIKGNSVSGRMDSIDLCNKCWNTVYEAALKSINLPKEADHERDGS